MSYLNWRSLNKKHLNIGLLFTLIAVWGWIGLSFFADDDLVLVSESPIDHNDSPEQEIKVAYIPHLDYEDPFRLPTQKTKRKSQSPVQVNRNNKAITAPWPEIKYYGLIRNRTSAMTKGLLEIETKSHLVQTRTVVEDIEVIRLEKDSILLASNGDRKIYQTQVK